MLKMRRRPFREAALRQVKLSGYPSAAPLLNQKRPRVFPGAFPFLSEERLELSALERGLHRRAEKRKIRLHRAGFSLRIVLPEGYEVDVFAI